MLQLVSNYCFKYVPFCSEGWGKTIFKWSFKNTIGLAVAIMVILYHRMFESSVAILLKLAIVQANNTLWAHPKYYLQLYRYAWEQGTQRISDNVSILIFSISVHQNECVEIRLLPKSYKHPHFVRNLTLSCLLSKNSSKTCAHPNRDTRRTYVFS